MCPDAVGLSLANPDEEQKKICKKIGLFFYFLEFLYFFLLSEFVLKFRLSFRGEIFNNVSNDFTNGSRCEEQTKRIKTSIPPPPLPPVTMLSMLVSSGEFVVLLFTFFPVQALHARYIARRANRPR